MAAIIEIFYGGFSAVVFSYGTGTGSDDLWPWPGPAGAGPGPGPAGAVAGHVRVISARVVRLLFPWCE